MKSIHQGLAGLLSAAVLITPIYLSAAELDVEQPTTQPATQAEKVDFGDLKEGPIDQPELAMMLTSTLRLLPLGEWDIRFVKIKYLRKDIQNAIVQRFISDNVTLQWARLFDKWSTDYVEGKTSGADKAAWTKLDKKELNESFTKTILGAVGETTLMFVPFETEQDRPVMFLIAPSVLNVQSPLVTIAPNVKLSEFIDKTVKVTGKDKISWIKMTVTPDADRKADEPSLVELILEKLELKLKGSKAPTTRPNGLQNFQGQTREPMWQASVPLPIVGPVL